MLTNKTTLDHKFDHEYFYNQNEVKERYIDYYLEAAHYGNHNAKNAFSSYVGKYMNTNILHELKEINNSILMIGGEAEDDIETTIENYKYYNPAIEEVYIPETKHLPQLESPDEVLEQIEMFL
jgi:pimeloyl-ACP methyl ester carboxylesterase